MTNQPSHSQEPTSLYPEKAFILGAFLGGPYATTYYFYHNYIQLGLRRQARTSLLVGIVWILLYALAAVTVPEIDSAASWRMLDDILFILVNLVIGVVLYYHFMRPLIQRQSDGIIYKKYIIKSIWLGIISFAIHIMLLSCLWAISEMI